MKRYFYVAYFHLSIWTGNQHRAIQLGTWPWKIETNILIWLTQRKVLVFSTLNLDCPRTVIKYAWKLRYTPHLHMYNFIWLQTYEHNNIMNTNHHESYLIYIYSIICEMSFCIRNLKLKLEWLVLIIFLMNQIYKLAKTKTNYFFDKISD